MIRLVHGSVMAPRIFGIPIFEAEPFATTPPPTMADVI